MDHGSSIARTIVRLIYFESPVDAGVLAECRSILDDEESERCDRFRDSAAREQYILAHAELRRLLSSRSPIAPDAWRFAAGPGGKPVIAQPRGTGLHFSLSHSAGLVACAVSATGPVGIDVEAIRRVTNIEDYRPVLSESELGTLRSSVGAARDEHFYRIWTAKEAYVKAIGTGLSETLQTLSIDALLTARPHYATTPPLGGISILPLAVRPGHAAAVAMAAGETVFSDSRSL